MTLKRFVKVFILIIFIFVIYNLFIWFFFTEKILTDNKGKSTGDLSRMGYLSNYSMIKDNYIDLSKTYIKNGDFDFKDNIDIVTIGDSFSNGMGRGRNPFFQDYLATKKNLNILNLSELPKSRNYIETISILLNSGFLSKIGTKYVIIESVQRKVVNRFTMNSSFEKKMTLEEISNYYRFGTKKYKEKVFLPDINFINNGNFKFLIYNFFYNFSDNAFFSKTYKVPLSKSFFNHKHNDKLLFYNKDLSSIKYNTEENLLIVNNNLNNLSEELKKLGIKLIFIPAVNKYDLYSKYIVNNKYQKDDFFTIFDKLKKDYIYIDTKKLFSKNLRENVKDLYYIDDMHWSYKASDILTNELLKYFK